MDAWEILETILTDEELGVVTKLARRSSYRDCCLTFIPANDVSYRQMELELKTDRRKLKIMFDKFQKEQIFGKFSIANIDGELEEHWVFNPFISFNGNHIHAQIESLFINTQFAPKFKETNDVIDHNLIS